MDVRACHWQKCRRQCLKELAFPDDDASTEDKEALIPKKVRITIIAVDAATHPCTRR